MRERQFTAFDGRLVGRPDLIRGDEVIDYKSGSVWEQNEEALGEVVKAAYVRQLQIYGYLVKEQLGWWPRQGVLLPLVGESVEVALDPDDCERAAAEAVALLDEYNRQVLVRGAPEELASPSPQNCRWCSYKVVCPAFWSHASPAWTGQLDGAAVEGTLSQAPMPVHADASRAIALDLCGGSEERGMVQITPLNVTTHPTVAAASVGDRMRIVGLRNKSDGALTPTIRTVAFRLDEVPSITLARHAD